MSSLRERLTATALLRRLEPDELDRLIEIGRIEYFAEGAELMAQGEAGLRLLVVLDGEAEVLRAGSSGAARPIAVVGAGEVLGEIGLLLDVPCTATVRALSELKCFTMDRAAYQELVDCGDLAGLKLGMELARTLASRLLKLNDRVLSLLSAADEEGLTLHDRFGVERQEIFRLWN